MSVLAPFPPGHHSDACKGLYLRGILDCGYSEEDLSHFFVEERKVDMASFTFEQVSDVGLDFITLHKSFKEAKLEETLELQTAEISKMRENLADEVAQSCKSAYFAAFFEGSGLNPREFEEYMRRVSTKTFDFMTIEELIEHLKAFKSTVSRTEQMYISPAEASVVSATCVEEQEKQSIYVLTAAQLPVTQLGGETEIFEALKQPRRAQDMYSLNGSIVCDSDKSSDYINWLNDYLLRDEAAKMKLEEMTKSVKSRLKDLSIDLNICAECMFYISNLQATMPVCLPLSEIYTDLGKTLETWANFENEFVWVLDTYVSTFLQQETEDLESIKDLVPLRTQCLEAYQKSGSEQHKDLFAYFNHQCQSERDRILRYQVSLFIKNFQEMATITLKKIADLSQKWEEFRTRRKT